MNNAAGGLLAAPVWGRFMRDIYAGEEPELKRLRHGAGRKASSP
jgi:hypothetical protein